MQGKCQGNYEAVRVKSNVKSSRGVVTFTRKEEETAREEGAERRREGRVCKCISQYESDASSLVSALLFMTANHLRYDLCTTGFFLHANGSIKDRIHHVK